VLVPVPGVVVATAFRQSVVACGLPSWPPGRCNVTFSIGLTVELLNAVLTTSEGDTTASLFGHAADAVHVVTGGPALLAPASRNAPAGPFRKLPIAVKMRLPLPNAAVVNAGLDASRVTEKPFVASSAALAAA